MPVVNELIRIEDEMCIRDRNGDYKVEGWVWESDADQRYCVVYGMNENGEKGLYRYDIGEKTIQRYFEDPAVKSSYSDEEVEAFIQEYNDMNQLYRLRLIIIIALGAVCVILIVMVIVLLKKKAGGNGSDHPHDQGTPNLSLIHIQMCIRDRFDTGLNKEALAEIADYFRPMREEALKSGLMNTKVLGVDINTLRYQVPGGMLSNLVSQLKEAHAEDKYYDVLQEIPRAVSYTHLLQNE